MARKITKKRKGFAKDYVETGNATEAAVRNFNVKDRDVARRVGSELLTFPDVIEEVDKVQKTIAESLTEPLLAKVHLEGLGATREVWKNNNKTGKVELVGSEPDYAVRHKYLDSAYRVRGDFAPDRSINVNVDAEELKDLIQHGLSKFRTHQG